MDAKTLEAQEATSLLRHGSGLRGKGLDQRTRTVHLCVLYTAIIILLSALLHFYRQAQEDPSQLIYSPAMEAVEYEVVDFGKFFLRRNDYMGLLGYPTDETDALWLDLYDFGVSGIPKWQADQLENKTEPIPGTDIYLIELDVFHQLHCLDQIRKALYPDRYGQWEWRKDGKVETRTAPFQHWEHCIDALRQTLMCHADVHPLQHRINAINGNLAPDLSTRHTCRNFDKIRGWAKQRTAPQFEWHVGQGLNELKPDFTLQDAIDTEV